MKIFITSLTLIFLSLFAHAHGDTEQRFTIEPVNGGHIQAGQSEYSFQIFDAVTKKPVSGMDLIDSHTKKLHFIAYDAALKEFNHVHPVYDGKIWKVSLSLPVDGNYRFWAQGKLLDNTEFSALTEAMVMGGSSENKVSPLGEMRTSENANSKIVLSDIKIKAGQMAMLDFTISRTDGLEPLLTPYLGAFAHVIATPSDGDELTHVHPVQGSKPFTGLLHATFPSAGDYRLWVQLNDRGELKTFALSVTVLK